MRKFKNSEGVPRMQKGYLIRLEIKKCVSLAPISEMLGNIVRENGVFCRISKIERVWSSTPPNNLVDRLLFL